MGKGTFIGALFCPWCSTETLERDDYRLEHGDFNSNTKQKAGLKSSYESSAPEYWCRLCGRGFRIQPSLRYQHAAKIFKEHRAMRPPDDIPYVQPVEEEVS